MPLLAGEGSARRRGRGAGLSVSVELDVARRKAAQLVGDGIERPGEPALDKEHLSMAPLPRTPWR